MPNIKSAKKRVLVNETKAARNKAAVSAVKTALKKFDAAVAEGTQEEATAAYKVAVKHVDKAAATWPDAQEQGRPQKAPADHQAQRHRGLINKTFCDA